MKATVEYKNPADGRPHACDVEVVFANGVRMRKQVFNLNPHR